MGMVVHYSGQCPKTYFIYFLLKFFLFILELLFAEGGISGKKSNIVTISH